MGAELGRILSSDLTRAVMTAERAQARTGVALDFDPLLQERNLGDVRGTSYAELADRGIGLFGPDYAPPGGETWERFHARVDRAWARIRNVAAETPGNLAVVTHGLVCLSLTSRHLAPLPDGAPPPGFSNTGVTIVGAASPYPVRRLDCTVHLEEPGEPGGGVAPAAAPV